MHTTKGLGKAWRLYLAPIGNFNAACVRGARTLRHIRLDLVRVCGEQRGQQRDRKKRKHGDACDRREGHQALVLLIDLHRRLHSLRSGPSMRQLRTQSPAIRPDSTVLVGLREGRAHPDVALAILVDGGAELALRRRRRRLQSHERGPWRK